MGPYSVQGQIPRVQPVQLLRARAWQGPMLELMLCCHCFGILSNYETDALYFHFAPEKLFIFVLDTQLDALSPPPMQSGMATCLSLTRGI